MAWSPLLSESLDIRRGTGLFSHGQFQLLVMEQSRFHLLFEGIREDTCSNPGCSERTLDFTIRDVDADRTDEITATGQECVHDDDYRLVNCQHFVRIYRYDGTRFSDEASNRGESR